MKDTEVIFTDITSRISSVRNEIYDVIKSAILSNKLTPKSHLNERKLSKQFGVSTTPIKEALRRLEQEGLVVTVQRKGTFVSSQVMKSIEEITWVRSSLEGVCARLAAIKITKDEIRQLAAIIEKMRSATQKKSTEELLILNPIFHHTIRQSARNDYLLQQVDAIRDYDRVVREKALVVESELESAFNEHLDIYNLIKAKNSDAAESAMTKHIRSTLTRVTSNDSGNAVPKVTQAHKKL